MSWTLDQMSRQAKSSVHLFAACYPARRKLVNGLIERQARIGLNALSGVKPWRNWKSLMAQTSVNIFAALRQNASKLCDPWAAHAWSQNFAIGEDSPAAKLLDFPISGQRDFQIAVRIRLWSYFIRDRLDIRGCSNIPYHQCWINIVGVYECFDFAWHGAARGQTARQPNFVFRQKQHLDGGSDVIGRLKPVLRRGWP